MRAVRTSNELHKQMTSPWQVILNAVQANVRARGAAYIMELPMAPKKRLRLQMLTLKKVRTAMVTLLQQDLSPPVLLWKNDSDPLALAFKSTEHVWLKKISQAEARRPVFPVRQLPCLVSENTNMTECSSLRK